MREIRRKTKAGHAVVGRPVGGRRTGMTIVELVLAIAITAVIGTAVASILFAFSYGSSAQSDHRGAMVTSELVTRWMSDAVSRSHMVLAQGSNYLVLWVADSNGNGQPELSELRRIEFDSTAMTLTSFKPPVNLASDTPYDLATTDFYGVTSALKGGASFPGQVWISATGLTTVLDNANVQQAAYVGWRITLASGNTPITAIGGAMLRN